MGMAGNNGTSFPNHRKTTDNPLVTLRIIWNTLKKSRKFSDIFSQKCPKFSHHRSYFKSNIKYTHFCGSFGSFFFFAFLAAFGFFTPAIVAPFPLFLVGESLPCSGDGRFNVFVCKKEEKKISQLFKKRGNGKSIFPKPQKLYRKIATTVDSFFPHFSKYKNKNEKKSGKAI